MNGGSYVVPVDPRNKETWGDSEHRLAYVSETTVIHKDIVQVIKYHDSETSLKSIDVMFACGSMFKCRLKENPLWACRLGTINGGGRCREAM